MLSTEGTYVPLPISAADQQQAQEWYRQIQRSRAKLVGSDGKTQTLPASLYEFLVKLLADLCDGQPVAIARNDAPLTTVEGARVLVVTGNVKRSKPAAKPDELDIPTPDEFPCTSSISIQSYRWTN